MQLDKSQTAAVELAITRPLTLVTGGAGTGKTTIVKAIAKEFGGATLCAPTGKAAARLREATGYPASTIHSLLLFDGEAFHNLDLHGQNVIVDESSMCDSWLVASLIRAKPQSLTLVGDFAQLHPVGAGAPFHDLINICPDAVANLTTCYRSEEAVCQAGAHVREGEFPGYELTSPNESFQFLKSSQPSHAEKIVCEMLENGEIDLTQDIVICARNGRKNQKTEVYEPATVNSLNPKLREIANPTASPEQKFDIGDRVICQKNFADMDVWNGTTGTVTAIDDENQLWVRTDVPTRSETGELREEVLFDKDMKKASRHAYALTIHKSQGSQYRKVVILALSRDHIMLSRPLIYTAITRAQKECTVIGQRRAFDQALKNLPERLTVLKQLAIQNTGV